MINRRVKEDKMDGTWKSIEIDEKFIYNFSLKSWSEDHFGD
jgi:hypothetical protein